MDWNDILRHYDEITGIHPAADLFPMVEGDELAELCADIKERGLQQPIVIWRDGTVLDGRNRLVACYRTNQEVVLEKYEGDDPVQFSLSANLHRRHLNPGQRAVVALKVRELLQPAAKERQGERTGLKSKAPNISADLREGFSPSPAQQTTPPPLTPANQLHLNPGQRAINALQVRDEIAKEQADRKRLERKTAAEAAKAVGASPRAVEQAARVAKVAPDLLPQVQAGTMALDRAHREAQQRQRDQAANFPQPEKPKIDERQTITLVDHKGNTYQYPKPKGKATFNQQSDDAIGWAMHSWNPVTGCNHGCTYCYARAFSAKPEMAPFYPAGFTPLFHHERLDAPANTPVPQRAQDDPAFGRVFVCSMADLFGAWVPQEWIDQVVASTVANPQWEYLYLTKFPQRYDRLDLPASGWIGASVDEQHRAEPTLAAMRKVSGVKVKWLSLEPLIEPITFSSLEGIDWIVIGAQSENAGQNPPFAPPFEWVADLVATARRDGCKVWMKLNLVGRVSGDRPGMKLLREVPA